MGPFRAGRFQQFTISRQRTRFHSTSDETEERTPTSGCFGYDPTCEEALDWGELDDGDDDYLDKPEDGEYYFKKAHAVAYAMAVVVQMNLICEGISYGYS